MMSLLPGSDNTDVNINMMIYTHYEITSVLTSSLFLGNVLHEQLYYQLTYSMNILLYR